MANASSSRLTTRLAGVLTALVMTITVNGGMLLLFNQGGPVDSAGSAVMAQTTTPAKAKTI